MALGKEISRQRFCKGPGLLLAPFDEALQEKRQVRRTGTSTEREARSAGAQTVQKLQTRQSCKKHLVFTSSKGKYQEIPEQQKWGSISRQGSHLE